MDATGSMINLLNSAKSMVGDMFERVKFLLKNNKIDEESVRIQFVAYRNYSSGPQDILQKSSWESKPEKLKEFLESVKASGGQGKEAIEVALQYANLIHESEPIRQIILIGDAPANSKKSIDKKRHSKWDQEPGHLGEKTFYLNELNKMNKDIKIHAFYLKNFAKDNFEEISKFTNGKSYSLDVNDSVNGTENLTNAFTEEIIKDVDNFNGFNGKMLEEYKDLLKKGHFN